MARFLLLIPGAMPLLWKILLWAAIAFLPGGVLLLPFALGRGPKPVARAGVAAPARTLAAPRPTGVE